MVQKVWGKGAVVQGWDPNVWRKDACEAAMHRSSYGNRDSEFGWEIDHINPNGNDELSNLRPLQWENNLSKSDGRLKCEVTYDSASKHDVKIGARTRR